MKILLDENLPRKLLAALRAEGHEVESVHTLRLDGLDNGGLYSFAVQQFEVCFTRDFGFIHNIRHASPPVNFKLLRVTLPQKPQGEFVTDFISAFRTSDWTQFQHGDDWP